MTLVTTFKSIWILNSSTRQSPFTWEFFKLQLSTVGASQSKQQFQLQEWNFSKPGSAKSFPKELQLKEKKEDNVHSSLPFNSNQPIAGSSLWFKISLSLQIVLLPLPSKPPSLVLYDNPVFPSVTYYVCDFESHLDPFMITIFAWEYLLWKLWLRH